MRKLSHSTSAGMSRQSKSVPQAKKVMPPAVPDMYGKVGMSNGNGGTGTGVLGLSTAVIYDTGDGAGRNGGGAVVAGTIILEHHHHLGADTGSGVGGPGQGAVVGGTGSTGAVGPSVSTVGAVAGSTAAAPSTLMLRCGPDGVVDYGLDDQGIDLTQSPGRDSPVSLSGSAGSGSRHSTASLDSGRASSYLTGASNSSNRSVSGVGSYGGLSSPRCSVSSCSIGSGSGGGTANGGGVGAGGCSHRLSNHSSGGGRNDHDVISEWLMEIHFHEYTYLFLEAGYDLPTIARMTPEDLTAIGIRKPNHRERLKRHIDALKLPDSLPGYVPGSIDEWLRLLRLDEYVQPLLAQGYQTVHDVTQLTWEDLEDIGIVKLGHQKKILLAIKRVKDIISGKMMIASGGGSCVMPGYTLSPTIARSPAGLVRAHYDDMSIGLRSDSSKPHLAVAGSYSTFLRQQSAPPPPALTTGTGDYGHGHAGSLHHHQMITYPHVHFDGTQAVYRRSSYDDSDITPTNEKTTALLALSEHHFAAQQGAAGAQQQQQQAWLMHSQQQQQMLQQHQQLVQHQQQQYYQGGGTLPRQHQRHNYGARLALLGGPPVTASTTARQRPIAKIVANNLKLPGGGVPGGVSPAIDEGAGGVGDGCEGAGVPTGYPMTLPIPLPPMLGQIENVEMATAALEAMHFSKYTSSPYVVSVQHHHLHHHAKELGSGPSGVAPSVVGQQQQQQQQPIYHNHQSMLLQSQSQQQLPHHHSTSAQSTPSPPTLVPVCPGGVTGPGGQPHLHAMAPFGYAGQTLQTTAEVHKVCGHDNKSNSSLESIDQIPFANENAGTIKQRSSLNRIEHQFQPPAPSQQTQQQHHPLLLPTLSSSSSTSSSSSSLTGSITTTLASGCIQQQLSPSASAPTTSGGSGVPVLASPSASAGAGVGVPSGLPVTGIDEPTGAGAGEPSQDIYGTNVLNDIGSMLANLTDELDAMLEEEKCAGISDNE
ncbi:uncharacterized protein LOC128728884 [Anopheles nili]|uniref:uncharacterized protein LOC128728884 n=1 Tax=Anopheles nili TaxID=185578 RepID=UPI00237B703C|nr:uncharacterized protein LOC128728884 [Anopheles nili]